MRFTLFVFVHALHVILNVSNNVFIIFKLRIYDFNLFMFVRFIDSLEGVDHVHYVPY